MNRSCDDDSGTCCCCLHQARLHVNAVTSNILVDPTGCRSEYFCDVCKPSLHYRGRWGSSFQTPPAIDFWLFPKLIMEQVPCVSAHFGRHSESLMNRLLFDPAGRPVDATLEGK